MSGELGKPTRTSSVGEVRLIKKPIDAAREGKLIALLLRWLDTPGTPDDVREP